MIDRGVNFIIEATFSLAVIAAHGYWFVWYTLHPWTQAQTTNLLSWEAIFITLFIGYQQKKQHTKLKSLWDRRPHHGDERG